MSNDMENNRRVCQMEKEAREKRLLLYAEAIHDHSGVRPS